MESSVGNVSIGFDWLLFRPLPRKILEGLERGQTYINAGGMSTFRCSSPCYHHKRRNLFVFHPMTNVTIIPSFIQKSFLSVIYSPRLINFSNFSSPCSQIETHIIRYHTTWRLTEHGDCRLEMPNSIPSSPCIEPLVNSNKHKQLPASSLQSFTAMSARGLFLSKLERRLQCQITHRYTQSWGHKRELTQRITARCEEYTASSPQLQLSAPSWIQKIAPQFMFVKTFFSCPRLLQSHWSALDVYW